MHAKWTFAEILHPKNIYIGKSDKARIDGGRVSNHGDSAILLALNTNRMAESPPFFRNEELHRATPTRSLDPANFRSPALMTVDTAYLAWQDVSTLVG